jgi:hypothetical protein
MIDDIGQNLDALLARWKLVAFRNHHLRFEIKRHWRRAGESGGSDSGDFAGTLNKVFIEALGLIVRVSRSFRIESHRDAMVTAEAGIAAYDFIEITASFGCCDE